MSQNEKNNETEPNDWHLKCKEITFTVPLNSVNFKAFYNILYKLLMAVEKGIFEKYWVEYVSTEFYRITGCRTSNMMCLKGDSVLSENGNVGVESAHSAGRASWRHESAPRTRGTHQWRSYQRLEGGKESRRRQTLGTETDKKQEGNTVTERFNPVTQRSVTLDVGRSGEGIWVAFSKLIEQQRSGSVNTTAVSI